MKTTFHTAGILPPNGYMVYSCSRRTLLEEGEQLLKRLFVALCYHFHLTRWQVPYRARQPQRTSISEYKGTVADVLYPPRDDSEHPFAHSCYVIPKVDCASMTSFATTRRIGSYCSSGMARNSFTPGSISCWMPGTSTPISA